jgi:hypothetical protein
MKRDLRVLAVAGSLSLAMCVGAAALAQKQEGVKWHDGNPFAAQDVKCTWDLLLSNSSESLSSSNGVGLSFGHRRGSSRKGEGRSLTSDASRPEVAARQAYLKSANSTARPACRSTRNPQTRPKVR